MDVTAAVFVKFSLDIYFIATYVCISGARDDIASLG